MAKKVKNSNAAHTKYLQAHKKLKADFKRRNEALLAAVVTVLHEHYKFSERKLTNFAAFLEQEMTAKHMELTALETLGE